MSMAGSIDAPSLVISEGADEPGSLRISIASVGRTTMGEWRMLNLPE
jgi:hypothetical protein